MALDHGYLNIPLAKRGDLNAQIDRSKAAVAKLASEAARAHTIRMKEQRPKAKALVEALSEGRLLVIALKAGMSPAKARARLMSDAHWTPALVIAALQSQAPPSPVEQKEG